MYKSYGSFCFSDTKIHLLKMTRKSNKISTKYARFVGACGVLCIWVGVIAALMLFIIGELVTAVAVLFGSFFFGLLVLFYGIVLKRAQNSPTACRLLILLPFLPFLWLNYLCNRKQKSLEGRFEENWIDRCCILRRPGSRAKRPNVITEKQEPDEGFSWYLHSYLSCCLQWGCCILNFTKNMSLVDAVRRYGERPQIQWEDLLKKLQRNPSLAVLMEYMNMVLPRFYFRVLPSGSIRERFGYPLPSTSILASDYDLMFVPDGVYVYDETTE